MALCLLTRLPPLTPRPASPPLLPAGPRLAVREGVLPGHAVVPPAHGRGAAPPVGREAQLRGPVRLPVGPLDRWRSTGGAVVGKKTNIRHGAV